MTRSPHLGSQIYSWFKNGKDSHELSKMFQIPESEVVELLEQARRKADKHQFVETYDASRKRATRKALLSSARSKKPVTLVSVKFLETDRP